MRYTRTWGTALVGLTTLALLAACGGGSDGDSGSGDVTLSVWMPTQEDTQKQNMAAIIDAFESANPTIKVSVEERSVDAHKEALRQAAGTDAGPDIFWYWEGSGMAGELVDAGMSLDLTDRYADLGLESRFSPAALAGVTQYGGFHGVPWTQQGEGLYYNKSLFEQAGITGTPTTYADLVADAEQLKAAGITPIQFGGTVNWHVMRLLDALVETTCGAEKADALNTGDGDWGAEPCVTEAFTELKSWGDSYLNDGFMAMSNDDSTQLFFSGQAAMAFEGTWFNGQLVDNGMDADEVGVFAFPTGTGRLYGFGEAFYVGAASKHPDEAMTFLDFATSAEGQGLAGSAWAALSVNTEVAPSADNPLNAVWVDLFGAATGIFTNNDQNFSGEVTTEYWRIQNSVLTGDIAPDAAGAEFQKFRDANK